MARKESMSHLNGTSLNSHSEPTVAAMAFEKAVKEKSEAPAIATGFVPPVVEKHETARPSPFKKIKNEDGEEVKAEADTAPKQTKPGIAAGFVPAPARKKQEVNPFKASKGPIKRPVSASVNHAAAKASEENQEEKAVEEVEAVKETEQRPSFTAALAENKKHSTTFRPSSEFTPKQSIDPFKHDKEPDEGRKLPPVIPQREPVTPYESERKERGGLLGIFKKK